MPYDPIKDEKKEFSLREWTEVVKEELDKHLAEWEGVNDYHKGKHTWDEWMGSFRRYMSW